MKYESQLIEGQFLKRYKRFFADVTLEGKTITCYVPNTGSLKTALEENQLCRLRPYTNSKQELAHCLEMVKANKSWVGVNTHTSNRVVQEMIEQKLNPFWKEYPNFKAEVVTAPGTRIDFVLWKGSLDSEQVKKLFLQPKRVKENKNIHVIEVKNVTLCRSGIAGFPDAVTERGQKHLRHLMDLQSRGFSVELIFTVQREDATSFSPADDIDPEYARLFRLAQEKKMKISVFICKLSAGGIELSNKQIPII